MIKMRATRVTWDPDKVVRALNEGATGTARGGVVVVGPTTVAWYGRIHEFGNATHPVRAFMRPALAQALREFPGFFGDVLKRAGDKALLKAGALVERLAKSSMKKGGGKRRIPSPPGTPPHWQSGDLTRSIQFALEIK